MSGMCGVGKLMKLCGQREPDACFRCGNKETAAHVLAYQDEAVVRTFHDSVKTFDKWMMQMDTAL